MVKAKELYACNKCGNYPIIKIVETTTDELIIEPACPKCGGETHFEKVRRVEEEEIVQKVEQPISLFEHCRRESGLTNRQDIMRYLNRHYGHG